MKSWVLEQLAKNTSFQKLNDKTRYILPNQIAKELQGILDTKGQDFLDAYKAELQPMLIRTNWLWVQNPKFVFQKWSKLKTEVSTRLAGKNPFIQPSQELVNLQVKAFEIAVNSLSEKFTSYNSRPKWVIINGKWQRSPTQ
jgi:hypothetical protein